MTKKKNRARELIDEEFDTVYAAALQAAPTDEHSRLRAAALVKTSAYKRWRDKAITLPRRKDGSFGVGG